MTEVRNGVTYLTADEAIAALTSASWTETPDLEEIAEQLLAAVRAVQKLCRDKEGNWLLPHAELPVGVFQEALAQALGNETLPEPRTVIDCVRGSSRAAWTLQDAIELAEKADFIYWVTGKFPGHELVIWKDGKGYLFSVERPVEEIAPNNNV